jgi:hypothetical protein
VEEIEKTIDKAELMKNIHMAKKDQQQQSVQQLKEKIEKDLQDFKMWITDSRKEREQKMNNPITLNEQGH